MATVNLLFNLANVPQISLFHRCNLGKYINLGVLDIERHNMFGPNRDAHPAHLFFIQFMVFFRNGISRAKSGASICLPSTYHTSMLYGISLSAISCSLRSSILSRCISSVWRPLTQCPHKQISCPSGTLKVQASKESSS